MTASEIALTCLACAGVAGALWLLYLWREAVTRNVALRAELKCVQRTRRIEDWTTPTADAWAEWTTASEWGGGPSEFSVRVR